MTFIDNWKEIEAAHSYEAQVSRISENFQVWLEWTIFQLWRWTFEDHKAAVAGCATQFVCNACKSGTDQHIYGVVLTGGFHFYYVSFLEIFDKHLLESDKFLDFLQCNDTTAFTSLLHLQESH